MKKRKYISLFCCICLLVSAFSGCGVNENNTPTEPAISIVLKENVPAASVGAAYDLSALIVEEDGVEYSYVACYTDPETGKTEELKVRRGQVTPKAEADISVTVTAARGEESSSIQLVVPIRVSADIMDKLLASDGIAGQADTGVTKEIVKESDFLQGENSISALSVNFSNPSSGGASILNLSLPHFLYIYTFVLCQKLTKMQIADMFKKYILEFRTLAYLLLNITMCELFTNNQIIKI